MSEPIALRKFDEVQIDGIHPRNPITDEEIVEYLQSFAVLRDQSGGTVDPRDLTPMCSETGPISTSRIRSVNGAKVAA